MATLFEKVAGLNGADKLPIHIFTAVLHELEAGRLNVNTAVGILGLDPGGQADLVKLLMAIEGSPDPTRTMRTIKDRLYLAEWKNTSTFFADENDFFGSVTEEVARQKNKGAK